MLPEGWVVVAAGNPPSERGVHFSMPRPLRNRFEHLMLEVDLTDWCKWAIRSGIRNEIIAFLRFRPDLLHDADATSDQNAWPTPRAWETVSKILDGLTKRSGTGGRVLEATLVEGAIGSGAAAEFVGFLQLFRTLPSVDEIKLNPDTAPLPDDPSAQIAIATALGRILDDQSIGKVTTYLKRMATEMRVLAIRDAAARDRSITHTPEFIDFGLQHAEVI